MFQILTVFVQVVSILILMVAPCFVENENEEEREFDQVNSRNDIP